MPTIRKYSKYGEFTLFYHTSSPFSNFHYCTFKLTTPDGVENEFTSSEQYFMYIKAVTFNDKEIATQILAETNPSEAKKLGREVKGFAEKKWSAISKEVMKKALMAKFTQNPELRYSLLVTQGSQLVECSPRDRLWGIGLGANNEHAVNPSKWRGANQLGKLLDEVRDEILQQESSIKKPAAAAATAIKRPNTSAVPKFHNNNRRKPLIVCRKDSTE